MTASGPACPVPRDDGEQILLAHGEGGRMLRRLIHDVLLEYFDNDYLRPLSDGAILPAMTGRLVMTTDSHVVSPLFFPGGDIGKLAVHGTVNDLAVSGATPRFLSLGLIIEEGLSLSTLRRVLASIRDTAKECGVVVVTGDTKVVPRGAADGLFLNTTGIGELRESVSLGTERVQVGDIVLVSGTLGDHGIAILSAREELDLGESVTSDAASVFDMVRSLFDAGIDVHFLRDGTRGGVAAVLHELADAAKVSVQLEETSLPVSEVVRGACEILGLDPLFIANEGKFVAVVAPQDSEAALAVLRSRPLGSQAAVIGTIAKGNVTPVMVRRALGIWRTLDEPSGAPLPRIC